MIDMFSTVIFVEPAVDGRQRIRLSAIVPGEQGSQALLRGGKLAIFEGARLVAIVTLDMDQTDQTPSPLPMTEAVDSPYVEACWGPRDEGPAECANRLEDCLKALGSLDLVHGDQWFLPRMPPIHHVTVTGDTPTLEAVLRDGTYRSKGTGDAASGLGFTFGLSSTGEKHIGVRGMIGSAIATPTTPNNVVVEPLLRLVGRTGDRVRFLEVAEQLLDRMVEVFEPDWAVFSHCGWWTPQTAPAVGEPPPGFASYVRPGLSY
jgi:hypothetical protein